MQLYFEVVSKLNKKIRTTKSHWDLIVNVKHLEIKGQEDKVKRTLQAPDIIRISQDDKNVHLYYRRIRKYFLCVVTRHLNDDGFIITVYFTGKVKEGCEIWKR